MWVLWTQSCANITDVTVHKDILRKDGRCYISCRGIISARTVALASVAGYVGGGTSSPSTHAGAQPKGVNLHWFTKVEKCTQRTLSHSRWGISTSTMFVGAQTPVLLQTAWMQVFNPASAKPCLVARAVMDSGS